MFLEHRKTFYPAEPKTLRSCCCWVRVPRTSSPVRSELIWRRSLDRKDWTSPRCIRLKFQISLLWLLHTVKMRPTLLVNTIKYFLNDHFTLATTSPKITAHLTEKMHKLYQHIQWKLVIYTTFIFRRVCNEFLRNT